MGVDSTCCSSCDVSRNLRKEKGKWRERGEKAREAGESETRGPYLQHLQYQKHFLELVTMVAI